MAYDMRPLITLEEKAKFLNEAVDKNYILFYEHDPVVECSRIERTERGIKVKDQMSLSQIG